MRCITSIAAGFAAGAVISVICLASFNQSLSAISANADAVKIDDTTNPGVMPNGAPELSRYSKLTSADEIATLEVIHIALSSVADGAAHAWRCEMCHLEVVVRPTFSFKDNRNRVCRHIEVTLTSEILSQTAEGIACRHHDGVWGLEG